jgi:hypothetical protein
MSWIVNGAAGVTSGHPVVRRFVVGLGLGVLLGLVAGSLSIIAILVAPTALVWGVAGLASRPRNVPAVATAAGALLGAGGLFMRWVIETTNVCQQTQDFCGNTNVIPLLALAIAMVIAGAVFSALVGLLASRRQ